METQGNRQMRKTNKGRLLLFPLPLQGHINPMIHLGNILHSKGFSITIIHTNFNSPNPCNYPHFTFLPISQGFPDPEASTGDVVALLSLLNAKCVEPFRDCLTQLLSNKVSTHVEDEHISCLISDAIWHFTGEVAESFKLPRIVLRTGGVSSFLAFAKFPYLIEKGYLPIEDTRLEEPVAELPPLRVKDLPIIKTSNPEGLYELVAGMVNATKGASGLIWNSFEELEKPALETLRKEFPIPIFPIGPFHKYFPKTSCSLVKQDQSCISWLDKQEPKSVIYVSFGSIAAIDGTEFGEIAWGLANSKHPFLWVVRPGLVCGSEWLETLPIGFLDMVQGRGHIVKWAPQQQVLAHGAVGAFWTHNGWNSTLESICEGVPMICRPCFSDQMVNARYASHVWRVGVQLEDELERGKIEKAIRMIMVENQGEEMRESVLDLKDKVFRCLSQGGSSYESLERLISYVSSF